MPKLNDRFHKYRIHRPSGQAIVTLGGKDFYLGPHGTEASVLQYDRLIANWLSHGRQTPQPVDPQPVISVNQVILSFWEHVRNYYRKPATPAIGPAVHKTSAASSPLAGSCSSSFKSPCHRLWPK